MPIPSSGPIKFSELQTEFGGNDPIGLGEYYAGGSFVAAGTTGDSGSIPTSGTIRAGNFYGSTAAGVLWGPRFLRFGNLGGKIRYLNGRFIYGFQGNNDSLILFNSTNGINWTEIKGTLTNPTENNSRYIIYDIAWNGSVYVAVVFVQFPNNTSTYRIFRSTDLNTWTKTYDVPVNNNSYLAESITYGNGKFVFFSNSFASSNTNTVYNSTDGINWTSSLVSGFSGSSYCSKDIIWNGFVFVAVGQYRNIAYSTNGTNWTVVSTNSTGTFKSIAWGNNNFVIFSPDLSFVLTSPNGVTWTQRNLPSGSTGTSVAWSGSAFVTSPGTLKTWATSPDGITWTARSYSTVYPVTGFATSTSAAGGGVVVSTGAGLFYSNDNGVTVSTPYTGSLAVISALETNGSVFVAGGSSETINSSGQGLPTLLYSYDAINWNKANYSATSTSVPFVDIIWDGSKFVAAAGRSLNGLYSAGILTSTDGVNWTVAVNFLNTSTNTAICALGMAWNGSKFVLVGTRDGTYHSSDGITWTRYNSGTSGIDFSNIAWGNNKFVSSSFNAVFYSSDGITWTPNSFPLNYLTNSSNINKIRFLNGKFIAVCRSSAAYTAPFGFQGTIHTSIDGITWTQATFTSIPYGMFVDVTAVGNTYYALLVPVSANDRTVSSCVYTSSDGGITWSPVASTSPTNLGSGYPTASTTVYGSIKRMGNKIFFGAAPGLIGSSPVPTIKSV